jgi:tripartite ATP-independent transporter DctM subunit
MEPITIGIIGILALLALIAIGVPIAFSMASVGIVGTWVMMGFTQTSLQVALNSWDKGSDFVLVALPMFILMGLLVFHLRFAEDLYDCVQKWFGRLPGGLAITAVVSSAGFGAVTGVSAAAVATMGAMTMPEMRRYKYDDKLATGSLAASGTLAILIPPSVLMVVYGIWTENSIGALFMAGIIPGILLASFFALYILVRCTVSPALGPVGERYGWGARFASLTKLLPVIAIFLFVIGGIYLGVFTPTEASGVGVLGVLLIGAIMRRLSWRGLKAALIDTGLTSGMIFMIIISGHLIARFLALTEVTSSLVSVIGESGLDPYVILLLFVLMYLVLGAVLDVWGMLILTLPFVYPVVITLGFDPIWFGIFVTLMTELALITPPIGVNVYVIHNIAGDIDLLDVFKGIMPFVVIVLLFVLLLTVFPGIALWLPAVAFG